MNTANQFYCLKKGRQHGSKRKRSEEIFHHSQSPRALIRPIMQREIRKLKHPPEQRRDNNHAYKRRKTIADERISSELVHQRINHQQISQPNQRKIPTCKWLYLEKEIKLQQHNQHNPRHTVCFKHLLSKEKEHLNLTLKSSLQTLLIPSQSSVKL